MDFGSELPQDVWRSMILPRLTLKEYIRFTAVCRSWRSIAVEMDLHRLPWLMLSQDMDTHTALFYSLQEGTTYKLNFTESASKSFCTGSTQGYMVFSDAEANFVFNPFSQSTTPLPPQYIPLRHQNASLTYRRHYYRKSVVSTSNPLQLLAASICYYNFVNVTCGSNNKEWSVFGTERVPFLLTPEPDPPLPPPPPPQEEKDNQDHNDVEDNDEEYEYEEEEEVEEEEENDDEGDHDDNDVDDNDDEYEYEYEYEEEEENDDEGEAEEEEEDDDEEQEEKEDDDDKDDKRWSLVDIIFYKGVLYGLSELFTLVRFTNLEDANTKPQQVMNMVTKGMPQRGFSASQGYLVESSHGDLLMVFRIRNRVDSKLFIYVTEGFLVFKLDDKSSGEIRWVEIKSLGDEMIFLGKNSSISVSAKGIPGFKGNCIYFSDDAFDNCGFSYWAWPATPTPARYTDNGVFHLEDGRIDSFLPQALSSSLKAPPVWVMPNKLVAID